MPRQFTTVPGPAIGNAQFGDTQRGTHVSWKTFGPTHVRIPADAQSPTPQVVGVASIPSPPQTMHRSYSLPLKQTPSQPFPWFKPPHTPQSSNIMPLYATPSHPKHSFAPPQTSQRSQFRPLPQT